MSSIEQDTFEETLIEQFEMLSIQYASISKQLSEIKSKLEVIEAQNKKRKVSLRGGSRSPRGFQTPASVFEVGDKVTVKNPSPGQATEGTITRVTFSRVYFTLEGGEETWKAPRNVIKQRN